MAKHKCTRSWCSGKLSLLLVWISMPQVHGIGKPTLTCCPVADRDVQRYMPQIQVLMQIMLSKTHHDELGQCSTLFTDDLPLCRAGTLQARPGFISQAQVLAGSPRRGAAWQDRVPQMVAQGSYKGQKPKLLLALFDVKQATDKDAEGC